MKESAVIKMFTMQIEWFQKVIDQIVRNWRSIIKRLVSVLNPLNLNLLDYMHKWCKRNAFIQLLCPIVKNYEKKSNHIFT